MFVDNLHRIANSVRQYMIEKINMAHQPVFLQATGVGSLILKVNEIKRESK